MAYSLKSSDNKITLTPEGTDLVIAADSEEIVDAIIPDDTTSAPSGVYSTLFGTYIKCGTENPSSISDKRCRIYIKYD